MSSSTLRFVYQSGPNKFSIGDLVYVYRQGRRLLRGDCGIVMKFEDGREQDEGHVKVRLLGMDGEEEWKDTKRFYYGGIPKDQPGKVIVKWGEGRPKGTPFHQEWSSEMVTELGFSLVRDPWGELHWLPPRDDKGDIGYGFRHADEYVSVAMQTVLTIPE